MEEQRPTWLAKRDESLQKSVSQLLNIPRDDGAAAALPLILRENGSKGKKL